MENKSYVKPEAEIVALDNLDVITASGFPGKPDAVVY